MDKAAPDTSWLIPDCVVHRLRCQGFGGVWGIHWYQWVWSWGLGADLTIPETWEILSRINGFGPRRFEETWASVERNNGESFWRSSL